MLLLLSTDKERKNRVKTQETLAFRRFIVTIGNKPCQEVLGRVAPCRECCFICEELDTCFDNWRHGDYYCPKEKREGAYCPITAGKYEELFVRGEKIWKTRLNKDDW